MQDHLAGGGADQERGYAVDLDHLPVHRTSRGPCRDPVLHAGQGLRAGEGKPLTAASDETLRDKE